MRRHASLARRSASRLEFDPSLFRTTWLWGVYGGWRGHYVLLTEPSTSPPGGLAQNVADGTAAWLAGRRRDRDCRHGNGGGGEHGARRA